jgi:diguanylate cyclase (GGDEF)-like protein/PAS domain S-box-containing protein
MADDLVTDPSRTVRARDRLAGRRWLPLTLLAVAVVARSAAAGVGLAFGGPTGAPLLLAAGALSTLALRSPVLRPGRRGTPAVLAADENDACALDLLAHSSDTVLVTDRNGSVIAVPGDDADLVPLGSHPLVGRNLVDLVHPEDRERCRLALQRAATNGQSVRIHEFRLQAPAGGELWLSATLTNRLEHPAIGGIVIGLHDITVRKHLELQLEDRALHDALTGLANRALFADRLTHSLQRRDVRQAVMYLDLDRFKVVNDSLGHAAGDRMLTAIAERLASTVRDGDTVARLGGDEFAVLIEAAVGEAHFAASVKDLAERILAAVRGVVDVGGTLVVPGTSIGVAFGEPGDAAEDVLRHADIALYAAKAEGRDRVSVFDAAMQSAASLRLQLENDLRLALHTGQLSVLYQPIVALDSGELRGFEALARWRHPALGMIAPDRFIPIAEESGVMSTLGAWVLNEACNAAVACNADRPPGEPLTMSVNVSAMQLADGDFPGIVREALARSGLPPAQLDLEVTERALGRNPEVASQRLRQLKELGVRISIDDFGTGPSSLVHLQQFPIDTLKIDQSFLQPTSDDDLPPIVRGLLGLTATMGLTAIAEGVESDDQRRRLERRGCPLGQGHLFAAPLDASAAAAFAASHPTALRSVGVTARAPAAGEHEAERAA